MIPSLQNITPYIQENLLSEIPLTLLLKLLANPSIINSASTVDHEILLTRVTTLLKSNHSLTRWKATKFVSVCLMHPILLLSSHTANILSALIKILESKCFISNYDNPGQRELVTLKSAIDCLGFVLDQIRGKPTLTREVLTPKLPAVISSLIDVIVLAPENAIPIFSKLLVMNTTTFRPFGVKLEASLKAILNDGENWARLDGDLRSMVLKSLALVSFILSREKQADSWKENVHALILEIKSVISIYEAFLELSGDDEYRTKFNSLPKLPQDMPSSNFIFGSLSVDINESPVEIFKISQRIEILSELLLSYIGITTPNAVTIPFGQYITIGEILSGYNTSFTPVKKDIRDMATRELIEQSIVETKHSGIRILKFLVEKFRGDLYPHVYEVLAILDSAIPVHTVKGKIKVDKNAVQENEAFINCILQTSAAYLSTTERFNDMTVLGRLLEAALILQEPREPSIPIEKAANKEPLVNGSRKKNNKNKSAISLSDLLSHQKLFQHPPPATTLACLRDFFRVLLSKCELSPGKLSLVLRFVIIDGVANMRSLDAHKTEYATQQTLSLLEDALLYPGKSDNSISIIPMVANLVGSRSPIYSLLTNPRFPLLKKKIDSLNHDRENVEDTEEEESLESTEFENGDFPIPGAAAVKRTAADEPLPDTRSTKRLHTDELVEDDKDLSNEPFYSNEKEATEILKKLKDELREENTHPRTSLVDDTAIQTEMAGDNEVALSEEEEEEEEMDSDFEIPEINVDEE